MTNSYSLTELLGHSILSKEFVAFSKNFKLSKEPKLDLDYQKNIYHADIRDKKQGVILECSGYRRYFLEFGEPKSVQDKKNDELIIKEITIDNDFADTNVLPNVRLPFDICFGDDKQIIVNKLNKKPYEKSPNSYGFAWLFQFDNFRLLAALNNNYQLIWIRLFQLTINEKEKIKLKKQLAQQNKNIRPANATEIANYLKSLPTIEWKKRKVEGDELFTDKAITETELLLKNYLQTLTELTSQKKAANIYNSIKKVVISLNKINDKNNNFIETMEREELCDFINVAVRKTGLEIEEKIDLTEQWREW